MKKGWDKYANEKRLIKKGYFRKYKNGNPVWKTTETSCRDCVQQSRKVEEAIIEYGKHVILTEDEIIFTGDDAKTNQNRDEEERSRRNEEIVGSIMAMQDVPKKQTRRKRKTINHPAID